MTESIKQPTASDLSVSAGYTIYASFDLTMPMTIGNRWNMLKAVFWQSKTTVWRYEKCDISISQEDMDAILSYNTP